MLRNFGWLLWSSWITVASPLPAIIAQENDLHIKGEVKIPQHKVELKAGELYLLKLNGRNLRAEISPGYLWGTSHVNGRFEAITMAGKTQTYTIAVLPSLLFDDKPQPYELSIKRMPLTTVLDKKDELQPSDATLKPGMMIKDLDVRNRHYKVYEVKMKPGHAYIISMSVNADGNRFHPYLIVEDPAETMIDSNGRADLKAQIDFIAPKAGTYRILAATLDANRLGKFTLLARESEKPVVETYRVISSYGQVFGFNVYTVRRRSDGEETTWYCIGEVPISDQWLTLPGHAHIHE
jgi:hypothetical protein